MQGRIDLEALSQVFTDHPWLAEAVSNGAWWGNGDGTVQVVPPLEDPVEVRAGLREFALALGCAPGDVRAQGRPSEEPVALRLPPVDLVRTGRGVPR